MSGRTNDASILPCFGSPLVSLLYSLLLLDEISCRRSYLSLYDSLDYLYLSLASLLVLASFTTRRTRPPILPYLAVSLFWLDGSHCSGLDTMSQASHFVLDATRLESRDAKNLLLAGTYQSLAGFACIEDRLAGLRYFYPFCPIFLQEPISCPKRTKVPSGADAAFPST